MNMNSCGAPRYDLKTASGLSNYRATLDQQLEHLVQSQTSDDIVWLNKLATLLNSWFRAEQLLLTPDSIKLIDVFNQYNIKVPDNVKPKRY